MRIPNKFNRMGIDSELSTLMDDNTKFLLYGNLKDKVGNIEIDNHGLEYNDNWIYSPNTTSFAIIPADSLPNDVLCSNHDWSLEIKFYIPDNWNVNVSRRVGIFGSFAAPRMDILLNLNNTLTVGSIAGGISPLSIGDSNLFTINFSVNDGFSFKINKQSVTPTAPQDISTGKNIRLNPLGILANAVNSTTVDSYAYMLKIKYIRMSNITR